MTAGRRRRALAIGLPLLLVVSGAGVWIGLERWDDRCAAVAAEVPADELPPVGFQVPDEFDLGSVSPDKEWMTSALVAARKAPAPLGTLRGVMRVNPQELSTTGKADLVGSSHGHVLLKVFTPRHPEGAVVAVRGTGGDDRWAVSPAGRYAHVPAGGNQLVLTDLPLEGRSRLLSVATDTGRVSWCEELGERTATQYGPAMISDPGSGSLFLAGPSSGSVMVSRRDLHDGHLGWEVAADGFSDTASLDRFEDLVLISRTGSALSPNDRNLKLTSGHSGTIAGSVVQARTVADGTVRWSYGGPDASGWVNTVVGVEGSSAVVLSRQTKGRPGWEADELKDSKLASQTTSWLVGLGPDGRERWRQSLGNHLFYKGGSGTAVGSDVILTVEGDLHRTKSQVVVARDIASGGTRWRKPVPNPELSPQFAVASRVGDTLLTRSDSRTLISIDLHKGTIEQPLGTTGLTGLTADDKSVTINAEGLILTFDLPR